MPNALSCNLLWACTLAACAFPFVTPASAQGPLTPTGSPGPGMKTLAQIEPRTDVLTLPTGPTAAYLITQPGSYYLSASPAYQGKNGILIQADNVVLDLNGFSVVGTPGTANDFNGISTSGARKNIFVRNGFVSGWASGVALSSATNGEVSHVHSSELQGLQPSNTVGINVGGGFRVTDCQVRGSGGAGYVLSGGSQVVARCLATGSSSVGFLVVAPGNAVLTDCIAVDNAIGFAAGEEATVRNCLARGSTSPGGPGFTAGRGSTLFACTASSNNGDGFQTSDGCTISYCSADANGGDGFQTGFGCTVIGCTSHRSQGQGFRLGDGTQLVQCNAYSSGSTGVEVARGGSVRDCNVFLGNSSGIVVSGAGAVVSGNNVGRNGNAQTPGYGIFTVVANSRFENNHVSANFGIGLGTPTPSTGNVVLRNSSRGNGTAYSVDPANDAGPLGTAATATSPFANLQ